MSQELFDLDSASPIEELFAGSPTGVELEVDADVGSQELEPWDPDKIRVTTRSFSLRNIVDMIDADDLELAPDFQRNRVWKSRQKSRLMESLLLQIPLPAFYFAEDTDGMLRVVDGLQRLSTVHAFVREQSFGLRELEYLHDEEGKKFPDLNQTMQRRLLNAQIVVHVIDPSTPDEVKYDIFKRINTGGEPLNAMEIRHCMSRTRSRDFLRRCAHSPAFDSATNGALRDHIRMQDREAALRFCAFYMLGDLKGYDAFGTLERLLDWAAQRLDTPQEVPNEALDELFVTFETAMTNSEMVFGVHAFRKWPLGADRLSPINRALFESWSVELARYQDKDLLAARDDIVAKARTAMTHDSDYIASITSSTSDARRVRERFATAADIVRKATQ